MKRMLLVALAAASVTLSVGTVWAHQVTVCNPACGVTTTHERQNQKDNQGKTNAGQHISAQGAAHNNAGITQPSSVPVVLF